MRKGNGGRPPPPQPTRTNERTSDLASQSASEQPSFLSYSLARSRQGLTHTPFSSLFSAERGKREGERGLAGWVVAAADFPHTSRYLLPLFPGSETGRKVSSCALLTAGFGEKERGKGRERERRSGEVEPPLLCSLVRKERRRRRDRAEAEVGGHFLFYSSLLRSGRRSTSSPSMFACIAQGASFFCRESWHTGTLGERGRGRGRGRSLYTDIQNPSLFPLSRCGVVAVPRNSPLLLLP